MADNLKPRDGAHKLEFNENGVFLTVYPPAQWGIPVNEQDLLREIEERQITGADFVKIRKAVKEMKAEPVYIAPAQEEKIIDGMVKVEVSKNKMEAYITVTPARGGKSVTSKGIQQALQEKNVVFGVKSDVIEKALETQDVREVIVAEGIEPVDGQDARIEYKVGPSSVAGKPTELVDGRVDFYNLNLIQNVEPGDVLAVKIPATSGTPGSTVTGEEIPAKPGKDVQLIPGKNTEPLDDNTIVASAQGHMVVTSNKISVSSVYEVKGDVDFSTGNIEFNGSVIIRGSVQDNFKVIAQGDVEIFGCISEGIVECSGNVRVKNGIIGRNKCRVKVGGSVFAGFIENATVQADCDIVVGDAIMHSKVSAKKSVVVGGKGVIVGGLIRAGEEIVSKIVGSPMGTITEVETGVSPEIRRRYVFLAKEKQAKEIEYDKASKAVQLLKKLEKAQGELQSDKKAILLKASNTCVQLKREIEEITELIKEIEPQIANAAKGKILVQDIIYPGVKVTIGSDSLYIRDKHTSVAFSLVNNQIKMGSYK